MTTDFLSVTEIAGDEVTQEQGRPQLNKGKSRFNGVNKDAKAQRGKKQNTEKSI